MKKDITEMLDERLRTHGSFPKTATVSQKLKDIARDSTNWPDMDYVQNEAIELILHKIARICEGDSFFIDSWRDIIGYSQLVIDALEKDTRATDVRIEKISINPDKHDSSRMTEGNIGQSKVREILSKDQINNILKAIDD